VVPSRKWVRANPDPGIQNCEDLTCSMCMVGADSIHVIHVSIARQAESLAE
jgi:hypothetical protein